MKAFAHLHLHTEFSLLDGATRINQVFKECQKKGITAVAITDHGNMYGAYKFFKEKSNYAVDGKTHKVKPIIGSEFYVAKDMNIKDGRESLAHLILLAKNKTGYKNLIKLSSISFVQGFYYKPRIDYLLLSKYSEGLICLSACLAGDIPKLLLQRRFDEAEELALKLKKMFAPGDFYLEIQNHGIQEQIEILKPMRELSNKIGVKLVATNDVHYISKKDAEMHDVLLCVQTAKTIDDPDRMKFATNEFYIKDYDEMQSMLASYEDALDNTLEIAEKCNVTFEKEMLYPGFIPPDNKTPLEFLQQLINVGIKERYSTITQEILDRIDSELTVITKSGYVEYYLIVWDFIHYAESIGIPVGPGRGSGVGSIIAYAIGITKVDPLKYNLLFERFLHSERVSAPDFDVDICADRRGEVIDYVTHKYGASKVVQIVTFGTMAARAAVKDVGRVFKVPYSETDKITKAMPNTIKDPPVLKKYFGIDQPAENAHLVAPELKKMYEESETTRKVVDMAIQLEGMPRNTSVHAAGVVIGRYDIDDYVPLQLNGDNQMTTQYTMNEIEELGLLKMDFLALRNLTDIQGTVDLIHKNTGERIDLYKISYDDADVYKLISSGNTEAIFQLESGGMKRFMKELKPDRLEDVIAGISVYRPGPMDIIPKFIANKRNPENIKYDTPVLKNTLDVTYGCIVYQEQVMKIVQDMAGYSLAQADNVRRIMSKKKREAMAKEREIFLHGKIDPEGKKTIDGAIKRGIPETIASKIFSEMETFASYAFNKSHAAAYAFVAYQTAYLRLYHQVEYLVSVLNNRITNADEIKKYTMFAREQGIEILPPDINKSQTRFSTESGKIRFGLAGLKNVGIAVVDMIINERTLHGEYTDLVDFVNRSESVVLNKRCLESMILSGAFDGFNIKRAQLMAVYEIAVERACRDKKNQESGQFSLFDTILRTDESISSLQYPKINEYSEKDKLKYEKEVVGVYISGHPLDDYLDKFKDYTLTAEMMVSSLGDDYNGEGMSLEEEYPEIKNEMPVTCGGIITEFKKTITKKGNREMGFGKIEDLEGNINIMLFPSTYEKFKNKMFVDNLISVEGKIFLRTGDTPVVVVENIKEWNNENALTTQQAMPQSYISENNKAKTLFLKYSLKDFKLCETIQEILNDYPGTTPVVVRCTSTNKGFKLNERVNASTLLINELLSVLDEDCILLK
ncbi:MAG: DNA polymerase III subunit alpha [Clostridia bacterium]